MFYTFQYFTYSQAALILFNSRDHLNAAKYYNLCIEALLQTELNDAVYRILTKRFIDLSDAFSELFNQQAAHDAIENAIKAFLAINIKTIDEQLIGDPHVNFERFHSYFQKQVSTASYRESTQFKNHVKMLDEAQQEQGLFSQISRISITEQQQLDNSIEFIANHLENAPKKTPFTPTLFGKISDSDYRTTAGNFLRIAKDLVQKNHIEAAIETYEQTLTSLRKIQKLTEEDKQIINSLTQQVNFLKEKISSTWEESSSLSSLSDEDNYGFEPMRESYLGYTSV